MEDIEAKLLSNAKISSLPNSPAQYAQFSSEVWQTIARFV
jgi:hypothetical protein